MKLSEKCYKIAMKYLPEGYTFSFRKSLTGRCSRKKKHIQAPRPVTRRALFVWLHECNHKKAYSNSPVYIAEYHCEMFAIKTMQREGIEIHPKSIEQAKNYVRWKIYQGVRRGLPEEKVDEDIAAWCGYDTKGAGA